MYQWFTSLLSPLPPCSCKHPTPSSSGRTLAPSLTLFAHDVHLVTFLDIGVIGSQGGDGLGLLDVRTRDELAFLEFPRVFKQLVLETVVDVFLDDDVFFVSLWGGKRGNVRFYRSARNGKEKGGEDLPSTYPVPFPG